MVSLISIPTSLRFFGGRKYSTSPAIRLSLPSCLAVEPIPAMRMIVMFCPSLMFMVTGSSFLTTVTFALEFFDACARTSDLNSIGASMFSRYSSLMIPATGASPMALRKFALSRLVQSGQLFFGLCCSQ